MGAAAAITLHHVTKTFRLRGYRATTLKTAAMEVLRGRRMRKDERFEVLRDVDLSLEAGRSLGIIGRNGSGKSTLLKLIAGIYRPDAGEIHVSGRVASLIELGAGFHPEFTGRENVVINGLILGLSRRAIAMKFDEIVEFSGLGGFIDEPTRTYSSGMYMRLGFAVAVHLEPDILLVDEVLAVGDEEFQKRCFDRVSDLRRRGTTLVLVTHDPVAVERWCDDAVWLDRGGVRAAGSPRKVLDLYHEALTQDESDALARSYMEPMDGSHRWGTREVEITGVRLADAAGRERYVFESGEAVIATIGYRVHQPVTSAIFGFAILRADGFCVYGSNTEIADIKLPDLGTSGQIALTLDRLDLVAGSYFIDVAVNSREGSAYDYHGRRYPFSVRSLPGELGVTRLPHRWKISPT